MEVDDAVGDRAEALGDEGARCERRAVNRKRHGAPHRVGDRTAAADTQAVIVVMSARIVLSMSAPSATRGPWRRG